MAHLLISRQIGSRQIGIRHSGTKAIVQVSRFSVGSVRTWLPPFDLL